ncbi:MAG: hypothetical protein JRH20_21135 [Deltaproteobacteria bacterium]|nr:hypothetical protein [Deltaproteobacteria bacterium]
MMIAVAGLVSACESTPELRRPETFSGESFGEKLFTLTCQRLAYSSSLEAHELDVSRPVDVSGSRYRLACRYGPQHLDGELAAREDPTVFALFEGRRAFIDAANHIFPGDELEQLQSYMERVLPLTDDGRFPALVEAGRHALSIAARDEPSLAALASMQGRQGYRSREVCLGALREVLNYPELSGFFDAMLHFGGEAGVGHEAILKTAQALSFELRDVARADDSSAVSPLHPSDPQRPMALVTELFFSDLGVASAAEPRTMVRRDWRGVARVALGVAGGVVAPFVDLDDDGLADTDAGGTLVTAVAGSSAPTPFHLDPKEPDSALARDTYGRALNAEGDPLFEYVDLNRTLLGALLRQAARLTTTSGDLLSLVQDVSLLGGPRKEVSLTARDGSKHKVEVFDSTRGPLLDLSHAVFAGLGDPHLSATLHVLQGLLEHEGAIAAFVRGFDEARQKMREYPDSVGESNFFDELLLLLREISRRPGLMEDVFAGLRDPRMGNLGRMLTNYLHYRDVHVLDPTGDGVRNNNSDKGFFVIPVDRSAPDSGMNRSIQQRLWHVIHNANGMRICNKAAARIQIPLVCDFPGVGWLMGCNDTYAECDLFEIKNGAVFYAEAIAGRATLRLKTENMPMMVATAVATLGEDFVLELLTGVKGMTSHPTPQAINRYLFMTQMPPMLAAVQDLPRDIDGLVVCDAHRGTLLSWEIRHPGMSCEEGDSCTFFQAFRPLAEAFARHNSTKMLIDLISLFHRHWPSVESAEHQFLDPAEKTFAVGTGIAKAEPLIADVLGKTSIWEGLRKLLIASAHVQGPDGASFEAVLVRSLRYWIDPEQTPQLRYRDGRPGSMFTDGVTPVPGGVSPIYLLADAARVASGLLLGDGESSKTREDALDGIFDVFLATEAKPMAGADALKMRDPSLLPSLQRVTDFLRQRLDAHDALADREDWLNRELPSYVERIVASPLLTAGVDLVGALREDVAAREALRRMGSYLLDEDENVSSFGATLTTVGDAIQLLQDDRHMVPLLALVGRILGADVGLVEHGLRFLEPAVAADTDSVFARLLGNTVDEQKPGQSALEVLFELAKQVNRVDPLAQQSYGVDDFKSTLGVLERFVGDPQRGVVKFFELIANRCGGPCE